MQNLHNGEPEMRSIDSAGKLIVLSASLALLTACAGTGPAPSSWCAGQRPIYVSPEDVLSEATAQEIEAYNLLGRARCGW